MRLTLFGFNVLALAMLVVPAFLIFNATHGLSDQSWGGFLGLFGFGSLACLTAMAFLSRRNPARVPQRALLLLSFGLVMLAVGFSWLFMVSLSA
ncbi:MAG TPA: hypothetical protein VEA15_04170 [Caulobacteraceae bacterium]|nr:hypothetical protein [Caulobacteraceae bacterium]